ncbi:MAG: 4Fe-4S dicluster domain-containing protein [Cellulomonas sp.]|nr:4Fe-4S dicluster domain-containing protein [Cellulomonas sp.]
MSAGSRVEALVTWVATQPDPVRLELVCAEHPDPRAGDRDQTVVRLDTCLSGLAWAVLLELVVVSAHVELRLDGCTDPDGARAVVTEVLAAAAGDRLTVRADPPRGRRRDVLVLGALPVSRRVLLGLGSTRAAVDRPPLERERVRQGLLSLGPADRYAGMAAPSADLTAEGCTFCGVCARACPAEALQVTVLAGEVKLVHRPSSCLDCGACTDLCPGQVLVRRGAVDWAGVLDPAPVALAAGRAGVCRRCGGAVAAAGGPTGELVCDVCAYRRSHPFGSRVMGPSAPAGRPNARPAADPRLDRYVDHGGVR